MPTLSDAAVIIQPEQVFAIRLGELAASLPRAAVTVRLCVRERRVSDVLCSLPGGTRALLVGFWILQAGQDARPEGEKNFPSCIRRRFISRNFVDQRLRTAGLVR